MGAIDHRVNWTLNDDGLRAPRRTGGSVALGYSDDDFTLTCQVCGDDFGNEPGLPVGVIAAHFERHHPDAESVTLELLWIGQGPCPASRS